MKRYKVVSSHPHLLPPSFRNRMEDDVNTEHKEGRSAGVSGNRERDVERKTGRWQLKANGV